MQKSLFLVLLSFWNILLFAQSPAKFSYQAIIRDQNLKAVSNTAVGVQISLLQGSISGQVVFVERHFPVTNTAGLVSLVIGEGTLVSGNLNQINWINGPYFFKIETDLNGGANYSLSGTSPVLTVPYALLAKNVESLPPQFFASLQDVNTSGVSTGQVMKWNGSTWVPGNDNTGTSGVPYTAGPGIAISNNNVITNTGDADQDITNELQTLSLIGNAVTLSKNGGSITLPDDNDNNPSNEIQTLSFNGSTLSLIPNGGSVNLPVSGDGNTTDELQTLSLSGKVLSLSNNGGSVNLPDDNDNNPSNEIQTLSLSGKVLSLSNNGGSINLPDDDDNNPVNEIQNLSLSGNTLSLSNNGGSVTLPSGGSGDQWGTQVVQTDGSLDGQGTTATPLKVKTNGINTNHIANGTLKGEDFSGNGASAGYVWRYSGTLWTPAQDGPSLSAGNGIQITGNVVNGYTISSAGGTLNGNGTRLAIPKWLDNNTLGSSNLYDIEGKIGVGTLMPGYKFHVVGDNLGLSNANFSKSIYFRTDGAGLDINAQGGNLFLNNQNAQIRMYSSNSYVAIGQQSTGAANDQLHVFGNALRVSDPFNNKFIRIRTDGAALDVEGYNAKLYLLARNNDVIINPFASNGRVGIKTETPSAALSVNGDANKPGGGLWNTFSDRRLKKDIQPYTDGLNAVMQIHAVTYRYNEQSGYDPSKQYVGIIAQDLASVAPYMVSENGLKLREGSEQEFLSVDPSAFTYMTINAIQEQQKQILWLTQQVQKLMAENAQLKRDLKTDQLNLKASKK